MMVISIFIPILLAFPLKILYLVKRVFYQTSYFKLLVILFCHCSHFPDILFHSYAKSMQPNRDMSRISSPSIAVAISILPYPLALAVSTMAPQIPAASQPLSFFLSTFHVPNSSLCPSRQEKRRLEVLEIHAQWKLLSTNDRCKLLKNSHPVPHFDKHCACVLNCFLEFFSRVEFHSLAVAPCLQL